MRKRGKITPTIHNSNHSELTRNYRSWSARFTSSKSFVVTTCFRFHPSSAHLTTKAPYTTLRLFITQRLHARHALSITTRISKRNGCRYSISQACTRLRAISILRASYTVSMHSLNTYLIRKAPNTTRRLPMCAEMHVLGAWLLTTRFSNGKEDYQYCISHARANSDTEFDALPIRRTMSLILTSLLEDEVHVRSKIDGRKLGASAPPVLGALPRLGAPA